MIVANSNALNGLNRSLAGYDDFCGFLLDIEKVAEFLDMSDDSKWFLTISSGSPS